MHRPLTISPTTDTADLNAVWSLSIRDVIADMQPLSIDDLLDFAGVIA